MALLLRCRWWAVHKGPTEIGIPDLKQASLTRAKTLVFTIFATSALFVSVPSASAWYLAASDYGSGQPVCLQTTEIGDCTRWSEPSRWVCDSGSGDRTARVNGYVICLTTVLGTRRATRSVKTNVRVWKKGYVTITYHHWVRGRWVAGSRRLLRWHWSWQTRWKTENYTQTYYYREPTPPASDVPYGP